MIYFFVAYHLIGLLLGIWYDYAEMKKNVPYERLPSGVPLASLRILMVIIIATLYLPAFLYSLSPWCRDDPE